MLVNLVYNGPHISVLEWKRLKIVLGRGIRKKIVWKKKTLKCLRTKRNQTFQHVVNGSVEWYFCFVINAKCSKYIKIEYEYGRTGRFKYNRCPCL